MQNLNSTDDPEIAHIQRMLDEWDASQTDEISVSRTRMMRKTVAASRQRDTVTLALQRLIEAATSGSWDVIATEIVFANRALSNSRRMGEVFEKSHPINYYSNRPKENA
jgi:hypothetical protein